MKRKWLIWFVIVLVIAVALAFCFRDALMVRLFPRAVLSGAIGETFGQLNERYSSSPVHLLTSALDHEGCQKVSLKLDTGTQFMGIAHYDLELQTQLSPNRIQGSGTVSTGAGILDLSLCMDDAYFAVSSGSLTDGTYYGITYSTFSQDIRSFELLSFLAGEEVISGWEASVSALSAFMARNYTLPELTAEDIHMALMGALSLKPEVNAGNERSCYTITFREDGDDIADAVQAYISQIPEALASLIRDMEKSDESEVQITFHLDNRQLTQVDAGIIMDSSAYQISVKFPDSNTIAVEMFSCDTENLDRMELTVSTRSDETIYQEKIHMTRTINGVQTRTTADYSWDLTSGDMVMDLVLDGVKYPIRLNLTGEGESFTLISQEFEQIIRAFTGKEKSQPVICTMTVCPGVPIDPVPTYKNLSDWSIEDFMLLITRLGGLVGIKLP